MENYNFYCEKCNYGTNIKLSFVKHTSTILHKTGKKGKKTEITYTCEKCNFTTKNNKNILSHMLNNHSTKEERKEKFKYYCECCDFGVFVKSMMDTHLNTNKHQLKFNDSQNINI